MCYSCATYKLTYLGSHTRRLLLYKINVNVCYALIIWLHCPRIHIHIYTSRIYCILYNIFKRGLAAAQTFSDLILHIHIYVLFMYIEKEKITFIFFIVILMTLLFTSSRRIEKSENLSLIYICFSFVYLMSILFSICIYDIFERETYV